MNDQTDRGPDEPEEDDTFDHFFSKRPGPDPDATRPVPQNPPPGGPDDATAPWVGGPTTPPPPPPAQRSGPAYGEGQGATQGWAAGPPPQQPYAAGPAEPPPPERRRSGMALPLVVIAVSLVVIGIVLFLTLGNWGSATHATSPNGLPPATTAPSSAPTPTESVPSQPTAPTKTPSDTSTSPKHEALPDGATDCHSKSFSVGPKTSCAFGKQVAGAAEGADYSDGSATLKGIYSPTTHKKYTLTCTQGGYLTCVSTTGAVVYVENP